ncbi:biotin/lipoyl-binding protein, partial [Xanthomonas sp. Kuri4-1]
MTANATPFRFPYRTVLAAAVFAAVLAGCGSPAAENAPPPPSVSAAPVLVKPISQWDAFSGRVEAVESVELRPRVSGYIDKVNYAEGQEVKKGDVLFTIDDRSYRAELARANADGDRWLRRLLPQRGGLGRALAHEHPVLPSQRGTGRAVRWPSPGPPACSR